MPVTCGVDTGHPVRLRIVHAMRGRTLTTAQLCARLPDVSKAMELNAMISELREAIVS